jgi:polyisoprenoid-binding protein YceI
MRKSQIIYRIGVREQRVMISLMTSAVTVSHFTQLTFEDTEYNKNNDSSSKVYNFV